MTPLYTQKEFNDAAYNDLLLFECELCHKTFTRLKKDAKRAELGTRAKINFCSHSCQASSKSPNKDMSCSNCNTPLKKRISQLTRSKSGNVFCSKSCAATYNNTHKTHGTRRSKLELWLEKHLRILFPNLEFHFNRKDAIGSELDIYIPSLSLAFELNGVFHCEPIFGKDKLSQVKVNDEQKFKACYDDNITLCIIDTSKQKYFKESTSKEFLDIIIYHIHWVNLLANLPVK